MSHVLGRPAGRAARGRGLLRSRPGTSLCHAHHATTRRLGLACAGGPDEPSAPLRRPGGGGRVWRAHYGATGPRDSRRPWAGAGAWRARCGPARCGPGPRGYSPRGRRHRPTRAVVTISGGWSLEA
jgi:hypothetical protein